MKSFLACAILGVSTLGVLGGCQSKQEKDVTTTGRSQYTNTVVGVVETTDAAKAVLEEMAMKNITANATTVDGKVSGEKADGTDVKVWITKNKTNGSDVQVTVGLVGGPSLGAQVAQAIKDKADGSPTTRRAAM